MQQVLFQTQSQSYALNKQGKIDSNDFPFTLNTAIGCLNRCLYCYTQGAPFYWPGKTSYNWGDAVVIKTWIANKLDKDLEKYKNLPQHLKRVQVNLSTEGYLPLAIYETKKQFNRDIMAEVLDVFQKHWVNDNKWMVHLLTKSHKVNDHLALISNLKEMVQLELTITTLDQKRARLLEGQSPSVKTRLKIIEDFSKAGVFVRVMCMPFIGDRKEALKVRKECFNRGAKGFKHKQTNYFKPNELLKGNQVRSEGKHDTIFLDTYV